MALMFYDNFEQWNIDDNLLVLSSWTKTLRGSSISSFVVKAGKVARFTSDRKEVIRNTHANSLTLTDFDLFVKPSNRIGTLDFGIVFRYGSSGGYILRHEGMYFRLEKFTTTDPSSSPTTLLTLDAFAAYPYDDIQIKVLGTSIKIYLNGDLIGSTTDPDHTSGTFGFYMNTAGGSFDVNDIVVETSAATLQTPSNLISSVNADSSINLAWSNNSFGDEDNFLIERQLLPDPFYYIGSSPSGLNSFIDRATSPGVEHVYKIRAQKNLYQTIYLQDTFLDADHAQLVNHTPDVNRTLGSWSGDSAWEIVSNCARCETQANISVNMGVARYKGSFVLKITDLTSFDFSILMRDDFYFAFDATGISFGKGAVEYLKNTDWVLSLGEKTVLFEVHERYLSLTIEGESLKYWTVEDAEIMNFGMKLNAGNIVEIKDVYFTTFSTITSSYSATTSYTITLLTVQEIWERYSSIGFERDIFVKRLLPSGTYEATWTNINDLLQYQTKAYDVCKDIEFALPNSTYSLGAVTVNNASLFFANQYTQMSNEDYVGSIFRNFVRHKSLVKIVDSFYDQYTIPGLKLKIPTTIFEGFIDDRLCTTNFDDTENIIATEILGTLLKGLTIADLGVTTSTTLDDLVYEIMNRSYFTNFFSVLAANIVPGFNFYYVNLANYEKSMTLFDLLQDLSIGHSIFYVKNGIFYYKSDTPTTSVVLTLGETPNRKIKLDKFSSGGPAVLDKLYWADSTEQYIATPPRKYDTKYTFDIKGVTETADRQGLLNYVGAKTNTRRSTFEITIPFLPTLSILDRVSVLNQGIILKGTYILDVSRLDVDRFLDPIGAFKIDIDENWKIKKIKHSADLKTILTLEKII